MRTKKPQVFLHAEIEALRKLIAEVRTKKISHTDGLIFLFICTYAWGKDGICMKTIPDIAKEFGLSRITVQQSTKRLQKAGYLGYLYRVRKLDESVVTTKNFDQVDKLASEGGTRMRAFFKITKSGFSTQSKGRYKKP